MQVKRSRACLDKLKEKRHRAHRDIEELDMLIRSREQSVYVMAPVSTSFTAAPAADPALQRLRSQRQELLDEMNSHEKGIEGIESAIEGARIRIEEITEKGTELLLGESLMILMDLLKRVHLYVARVQTGNEKLTWVQLMEVAKSADGDAKAAEDRIMTHLKTKPAP